MAKKDKIPKGIVGGDPKKVPKPKKPTVETIKGKDGKPISGQEQPQMTEEQAFASYTNQVISNTILDIEATKQRTVDNMKALIQQLGMYMAGMKKLEEENKKLREGKK